jgi:23S rRNA pseudouridine2605 synthase
LNKFLSMAGFTSRRKADELIRDGSITVNGEVVLDLGHKIDPQKDIVFVHGRQISLVRDYVYLLFNKPKDTITTMSDERGRKTVLDYVHVKERVFPIGRLDRNTTGVLLLTNDGDFANRLMHPRHEIEKAYKATLDRPLSPEHAEILSSGIRLSEGKTKPAEVHYIARGKNKIIGIVIREGRNRQIHRMFEALGYVIEKLDRVAYGNLTYEGVPRGAWRYLIAKEVKKLKQLGETREGVEKNAHSEV